MGVVKSGVVESGVWLNVVVVVKSGVWLNVVVVVKSGVGESGVVKCSGGSKVWCGGVLCVVQCSAV